MSTRELDVPEAVDESAASAALVRTLPARRSPPLVDTLAYIAAPNPFVRALARRYGDTFRLSTVARGDAVCFSHPEAIRAIFTAPPGALSAAAGNAPLEPFLGKHSLLLLDGERHLRERRLMMPPFHGERMRHYGALIRDITRRVTAAWQPGEVLRAAPFMAEISLETILGAVFGITGGPEHTEYKRALLDAIQTFTGAMLFFPFLRRDLGPWSPGGKKARAFAELRRLLMAEIMRRRAEGDAGRQDIMTLLLGARDEAGMPMSDDELHDELLTLLIAGHETTGTALGWALYWIHHTPGVLARLRGELHALGPELDPDQASRLPYLDAVCKETLRIKPIIPMIARGVLAPISIQGVRVEPGQRVLVSIYLTHHRHDLYPEPHVFRPERFLERKYSPYEYLPFGGGVRRCLGIAFAQYEMKIVLATLLGTFDVALANRLPVVTRRKSVALAPSGGPRLRIRARR